MKEQTAETTTPTGMIQGGWEFVWGSYGVSWVVLVAFTFFAFRKALTAGGTA